MIKYLDGKKTYLTAGALALVVAANYLGLLNDETAKVLFELLGIGSLAALRAAISKS